MPPGVGGSYRPERRHGESAGSDAGGGLEEAGLFGKTSHGAEGQLRRRSMAVGRRAVQKESKRRLSKESQ